MSKQIDKFNQDQLKKDLSDIRSGDTVRIHQRISAQGGPASGGKEKKGGERIQIFEGLIIAKKHGKGVSATITVRKVMSGIGVERIFPIHSPSISKIEITKKGKARRSKLYYLRTAKGKRARLKREEYAKTTAEPIEETPIQPSVEEKEEKTVEPTTENK
ncbi:50S ribosomal protein L19 [Patescibacteria group bacterium]|nr:50S ribosomal protein L19 [Patescibacteria group bacterium]MBU4367297.1 50S ribosomal protein L19 [Patescibacteria group bacterium]MBU4461634.1 50S ribosomal protein L19 [Patescibacteria group bacterium]MCG2699684.1 50S ribosomal protein L19 [Candidatus Parcubacteria bacterium]